jgi:hypothetical protein
MKVHVSCRRTPARLSLDYQALPGGLVSSSGSRAVHGRESVTESGHLKRTTLVCRARLQPAECVARADAHGGCAGDERLMEEWVDGVSECRIATCEQAEAFDSGGADDVAFVFGELPENFGGKSDVRWRASGARNNEAEMPAGTRCGDRYFREDDRELGGVRDEEVCVLLRNAAGDIRGADALLRIAGGKRIDELARDAATVGLREETLGLLARDCKAPAGGLHEIGFHAGTRGMHAASRAVMIRDCMGGIAVR